MQIVAQQLGIVVEHLLEVGNAPVLIDAVAVEAPGELVVDAASRHLFQCESECLAGLLVTAVHGHFQQQIQCGRMGKLGL